MMFRTDALQNLTKREIFAALAMLGMLADGKESGTHGRSLADVAVQQADALILKLDATKK